MIGYRVKGFAVTLVVALSTMCATPAPAFENSVFVESKEVLPGQTSVTVGVYVSNAVDISAIVFPFEFRTVGSASGPHSFTQGPVWRGWTPGGRADTSSLGLNSVFGLPAWIATRWYPVAGGTACGGPISGTYTTANGTPDNLSPDGSVFTALARGCGDACDDYASLVMFSGQEVPGVDVPSFVIQFDANTIQGAFEIDTCCVRPANHLYFIDRNTSIVPGVGFTKGVITIACHCSCHGDPECDGQLDIVDVVETINVAFRGTAEPHDQDCTHSRTDVDASAATNVSDVVLMIRAVFDGELPNVVFDNPCN